ncbi:MAG: periplasmic heavy metal sensor [Paracoccaceae bacterium]
MPDEMKPATRPWVRILLIGSLGLNLLVAGIIGGSMYRVQSAREGRPPPPIGAMLFRELSDKDRHELRAGSHARGKGFREERQAEGQAVAAALMAQPFDRAVLQKVLSEQAQSRETFQRRIQQAWLDRVEAMDDDERAAYGARLQARMSKDRKRKKH